MKLSTDQKELVLSLLRRLGCRQKELSHESGYSSGNLSETLSHHKDKGIEPGTWAKLVAALERMAAKKADRCLKDPSIAADIAQMAGWNGDDTRMAGAVGKERLHTPRGTMPLEASNYISRSAEQAIADIVQNPPRSAILQGGVSTGRSSWLLRLQQAALAAGATVVAFDEAMLTNLGRREPITGFLAHLSWALGLPALADIANGDSDYRNAAVETIAILRTAQRQTALFIVVDEVDGWQERGPHDVLVQYVNQLQLQLVGSWGHAHDHAICIISALPPAEWSTWDGSRLEGQSTVVPLTFFDKREVHELTTRYGLTNLIAEQAANFTGGHPHQTQTLLWDCHNGGTVEEVLTRATQLDHGAWQGHASRVRALLQRLSSAQGIDQRQLLKKYVGYFINKDAAVRFSPKETALLKSLGMVDGPASGPVTSQFFLTAAQAWLDEELV